MVVVVVVVLLVFHEVAIGLLNEAIAAEVRAGQCLCWKECRKIQIAMLENILRT